MAKSLGKFLAKNAVTLDTCANEALHLSGAIQRVGALVVLDKATDRIVGSSDNLSSLIGCPSHEVLLGEVFSAQFESLSSDLPTVAESDSVVHTLLDKPYQGANGLFDVAVHELEGLAYIEFLPASPVSEYNLRKTMRFSQEVCSRIVSASSFESATEMAVTSIRELTGLAKCMVYQFMPDWSGRVVAESKSDDMTSYLNLFFPAHDIPEQARHLYSLVPSRLVATVDNDNSRIAVSSEIDTLDLTYSLLRSVSPMHTAYLRNMDVQSSFSIGLRYRGALWGLIACHHNEAGVLALDVRRFAEDIANALMTRLEKSELERAAQQARELRSVEAGFASALRTNRDVQASLRQCATQFRAFMRADGFAAEYDGELITDGRVPPIEFIHDVLQLGIDEGSQGLFMSSTLPKQMPAAAEYHETACGVLVLPVKFERNCLMVWFRGPMEQASKWAGDPTEKEVLLQIDGTHRLSPRNSFETWNDENPYIAHPWIKSEVDLATSLFQEILDMIAYHSSTTKRVAIEQLRESHAGLKSLTHSAVHDIKGPLRTIDLALTELLGTDASDEASKQFHEKLARSAEVSVNRLGRLIDQLLAYIELGRDAIDLESLALLEVVTDVEHLLGEQIGSDQATVTYISLGTVTANRTLLTTAIQNLVGNAIRYRHPERAPAIEVSQVNDETCTKILVTDNGIGIDSEHAERIFQPFKRLHRRDEIEGTGIGLASVRRVAELHGGRVYLDTDYDPTRGSRFVLELPLEASN
ncbi:MAG: ATP-binding protein [Pseudomonadota bacterium]